MKKLYLLLVLVFFTGCLSVNAGGPLVVKNGMAITYGTKPLVYRYDLGPLGIFSNTEARQLFEDRFMDWEAIPTALNSFKRDNPDSLTFDVKESGLSRLKEFNAVGIASQSINLSSKSCLASVLLNIPSGPRSYL